MAESGEIDELEEKLINLIKERRNGNLADLRQYHEVLSELRGEVLETIFAETWLKREFAKKQKMNYAEKMGLIFANFPNAYKSWDAEQEKQLTELHASGKTIREISQAMQRQEGGIRARLKKLGLLPP